MHFRRTCPDPEGFGVRFGIRKKNEPEKEADSKFKDKRMHASSKTNGNPKFRGHHLDMQRARRARCICPLYRSRSTPARSCAFCEIRFWRPPLRGSEMEVAVQRRAPIIKPAALRRVSPLPRTIYENKNTIGYSNNGLGGYWLGIWLSDPCCLQVA